MKKSESWTERPKQRRKIQGFDNVSVLSNEFIRRSLEDTSDLLRVVRTGHCSLLDIWRSNRRLRKDEIFDDPLLFSLPRHGFKRTEIVHEKKERNDDDEEKINFMMMMVFGIVVLGTRHHSKYLMKNFSMSANDVRYQERQSWMRCLLHGPTCNEQIRRTSQAFQILCCLLRNEGGLIASRNVIIHEIVAQFLHILGHGSKNSTTKASFRRSGETVSRQFHSVLRVVLNVGKLLIQ